MDSANIVQLNNPAHAQHLRGGNAQASGMTNQQLIQHLLQCHGLENTAGACHNEQLSTLVDALKEHVDSQSCPQAIKDDANSVLDSAHTSCSMPTSAAATSDLQTSDMGSSCQALGQCMADEATGSGSSGADEGSSGAEGGGSSGVGGGLSTENNLNALGSAGDQDGEGDENWLVAMAKGLAKIQGKFLDAAMKNLDTMSANAGAVAMTADKSTEGGSEAKSTSSTENSTGSKQDGGTTSSASEGGGESEVSPQQREEAEKRDAFLQAQAMFQANMQMFNLIVNMTATTLKTIGEGMANLARKQ